MELPRKTPTRPGSKLRSVRPRSKYCYVVCYLCQTADGLEADRLLVRDGVLDLAVFYRPELVGANLGRLSLYPHRLERGRAQQASDMIGAERRLGARHYSTAASAAACFFRTKSYFTS
jgi:hypothetical protein